MPKVTDLISKFEKIAADAKAPAHGKKQSRQTQKLNQKHQKRYKSLKSQSWNVHTQQALRKPCQTKGSKKFLMF